MKAFWRSFCLTFIVLVFLVYIIPTMSDESDKGDNLDSHKSMKVDSELDEKAFSPALGRALWINQPIESIIQLLGDPDISLEVSKTRRIYQYYQTSGHFLSIETRDERVVSVMALGKEDMSGFFNIGMTRDNVRDEIPLKKSVPLKEDNKIRDLDLSKQERKYIPIVAFDNHSYGILLFRKEDKCLAGVVYVASDELSRLNVYEDNRPKNMPTEINAEEVDQESLNRLWLNTINALREQKNLPELDSNELAYADAQRILKFVKNQPQKQLYSSASVFNAIQAIYPGQTSFFFSNQQFQYLYSNLINLFKEQDHIHLFSPKGRGSSSFSVVDSDSLWLVQESQEGDERP